MLVGGGVAAGRVADVGWAEAGTGGERVEGGAGFVGGADGAVAPGDVLLAAVCGGDGALEEDSGVEEEGGFPAGAGAGRGCGHGAPLGGVVWCIRYDGDAPPWGDQEREVDKSKPAPSGGRLLLDVRYGHS